MSDIWWGSLTVQETQFGQFLCIRIWYLNSDLRKLDYFISSSHNFFSPQHLHAVTETLPAFEWVRSPVVYLYSTVYRK